MIDVFYKNNVLVKPDGTAVNLEQDTYRRILGKVKLTPLPKIGCKRIYRATVRYAVVGTGNFQDQMNEIFEDQTSNIIEWDLTREVILKEEKLDKLLATNLDRIFKIIYETEKTVSEDECAQLCYC